MDRRGRHDEEMFLNKPSDDCDSPTIEPLRIFKPQSPVPAAERPQNRYKYPAPPSAQPTFPLPPGASSSAEPLPYPDDDDLRPSQPSKSSNPPYPDDGYRPSGGRTYSSPSSSVHFDRLNDTTPRLEKSPVEKRGPGLAERRGTAPKPLPGALSPTSPVDQDELFAKPLGGQHKPAPSVDNFPDYHKKPYYPPPRGSSTSPSNSSSHSSNSNARPQPPDDGLLKMPGANSTPVVEPGVVPGGGIEARYAASGISGTATLNSLQSAAATQRLAQYSQHPAIQQQQAAPNRPWTPTETPDQQPHGPPTVYQGANPVSDTAQPAGSSQPRPATSSSNAPALQESVLEQDFRRMQMADPPPAYSSINTSGGSQILRQLGLLPQHCSIQGILPLPMIPDLRAQQLPPPAPQPVQSTPSPFQGQGPSSPPPLPEGWMAHLDQTSGQYYYIHLATQATQWEFPKGPNPLNHETAPLSPTASTYGNPLGSPMFGKQSALASPMFPPHTPGAGVDMYRVQPTNGVYFGPYLRYVNMDVENGRWLGSILIVTDGQQPPTIHIHLSADLSPNPRQLVPHSIHTHQRWQFFKYDIELPMNDGPTERWTYAVTSHLGCTRYEFVVAGRHETNWRFVAHSGNDFAASTSQNERSKLGGVGFMWKDVLQKNVDCGGFHVQLGLGDQVYGDRLWKEVPLLKQWLAMQGKENRRTSQWTARHEEDVNHAYFHFYTSHFDQPFLREAWAQIPHVCQIDDHDIFDGYGSYPDYMQNSQMFKNIGRIAIDMYLLFQHHTTLEVLRNVSHDLDLFTITGQGWHFVKYLGPAVVVVGADVRSERSQSRVLAGPTYQGLFPKVAMLPPSVQHCLWMVSVPLVYPRLDTVESLANTFATGKKAVNTTYNVLGKVTSSVAGIVGGKDMVASGFSSVKKAVGKSGLMGNVVNQFGDLDISEILKDMWTHESKDLERTYLIRTLQGIAHQKGIRMTFLSGDVNSCGAGLVHDPTHPSDHKTMYQVITSPIVAAPASNYILKMLHSNRTHYIPTNGNKSTPNDVSDTKEDMMEIFHTDASGTPRELKKLMGRRNYIACVAYDPEAIAGTQYAASIANGQQQQGLSKLSLAIDFIVQGDGAFTSPTKYGPVIVPHLEFGR
ncbi:hypothetical protein PG999_006505 [Apiospora kogelbergensis]|uniref:WW domain-containing protein n=1 Tax=Apiospora kogelbergensis TaxID=1337665 RepID=A0AAW0QVD0_9PEZI